LSAWYGPFGTHPSPPPGVNLVLFIAMYTTTTVFAAIIIGVCHNRCRNLFIPIWIHFLMNFTLARLVDVSIPVYTICTVLYVLAAIGYIIWHKTQRRKDLLTGAYCE